MNRELVQPGHNGKAAADAQTRQFYRLLDVLGERNGYLFRQKVGERLRYLWGSVYPLLNHAGRQR
jgi:alpha-galactosidase